MHRNGRLIVTFAVVATPAIQVIADVNTTHLFNPDWLPHARFHAVVGTTTLVSWAATSLWLLWRPRSSPAERRLGVTVAALYPVFSWAPFFLAAVTPGAALEDVPGTAPRLGGIPLNMGGAAALTLVSLIGYGIYRNEVRTADHAPAYQH